MNWSSAFVLNTRCPVMRHSHKYLKPLCLYPRINFFGRFLKTWFQWIAPLASNISPSSTSSSSSKRFMSTALPFPALLVTVSWCDHFKSDRGIGSHRWGDGRRLRDPKQVQDKKLPRTGSIFIHLPTARSSLWENKQNIAIVKWFQIGWIFPSRMCTKPRRTPSAALVCCADQIGLLTCRSLIMLSARWGSIFWLWHHHRHHDSHHQPVIMIIRWFT